MATLLLSLTTFAQEIKPGPNESGFIIGVQGGYVATNWSNINQNAFANELVVVRRDTSAGARPYIGYMVNKYLAGELGYTYLGQAAISRWNTFDHENLPETKINNWAIDASVRLSAPVYNNAGLFATFGAAYLAADHSLRWQAHALEGIDTHPHRQNVVTYQTTFGFGAYKDIDCHCRVEILWKHFEGQSFTNDTYQPAPDFYAVGFVYRI
jgi:hypothetical protein